MARLSPSQPPLSPPDGVRGAMCAVVTRFCRTKGGSMAYDPASLEGIRLTYLQENRPASYRDMVKRGILDEHLVNMADFARKRKAAYMNEGAPDEQTAWNWAIRTVLLDSQPD